MTPNHPVPDHTARPTPARTPCSDVPCDTGPGEPCERHEREWAHTEDDHELCGIECETVMPSEQLRSAVLYPALPGAKAMLAELRRRTAAAKGGEQA